MLNKNDPLIGVVQEVMNRNHAEREAVKVVNEYFGIEDRKALPHEYQAEWNDVYNTVLSEGLESLAPPYNKTTKKDVLVGRGVLKKHPTQPGKHILAKEEALDEDELNDKGKGSKQKAKTYKHKTSGKEISSVSHPGKEWDLVNEDMSPNPTSAPSSQSSATSIRKATVKQNVRMGGNPTGQPNSNRPANAYRKAATKVNIRVGGNPTSTPSSSPSQSGSRPMEEGSDVTSPSAMGIKKPNYAPAGTTPSYVNKGPQMVNRAAKTSLPPGTVAKSIKESSESGSQVKGQSTYGSLSNKYYSLQAQADAARAPVPTGSAAGSALGAFKPSSSAAAKPSIAADSKPRFGAGGQSEFDDREVNPAPIKIDPKAAGIGPRPAASPSTSGTSTAFGGPSNAINNLSRRSAPPGSPTGAASGLTTGAGSGIKTSTNRPPGSPTGAASGLTTGAGSGIKTPARTNPGISKLNADSQARQQAAKIGNQTGGVNTKANGPAAKPAAPKTAARPAAPKTAAPKVKPVRKAAPTVQAKPKMSPLQQQMARSKTGRDAVAGPRKDANGLNLHSATRPNLGKTK